MILLVVREDDEKEPMGFNCGDSNIERAQWIAEDLRNSLNGDMRVYGPEMTNGDDFVVTVMCRQGSLNVVTRLVEGSVAIWRARGYLN